MKPGLLILESLPFLEQTNKIVMYYLIKKLRLKIILLILFYYEAKTCQKRLRYKIRDYNDITS